MVTDASSSTDFIPTRRNSLEVSVSGKGRILLEWPLKTLGEASDFQAEYTPAVISNGYHQRMSVSVVASPRNHFRYNSLTVPTNRRDGADRR
jgi:hypothetical protein